MALYVAGGVGIDGGDGAGHSRWPTVVGAGGEGFYLLHGGPVTGGGGAASDHVNTSLKSDRTSATALRLSVSTTPRPSLMTSR